MPGPASHLILIEQEINRVLVNPGTFSGPVLDALANHKKHAALGALGPDMIFWADWSYATPVVNAVFDIYHDLDEIYTKLSTIWEPLENHINKTLDSLSGGVASELAETLDLVGGIVKSMGIRLITQQIDLLSFLKPDLQKDGSDSKMKKWNWLDYLHNRRTGEFTKELVRLAHESNDPSLRAYSYGWLSHVTGDIVGHAYVNTAVGGPWRSHWHRHFITEKFMDTWVWGFYRTGATMPLAAAPGEIPFDYASWQNVNESNLHEFIDLGSDLPSSLQNLIAQALYAVYRPDQSFPHPHIGNSDRFLQGDEINRAYQMQFKALELITGRDRFISRPEPPSVFNDNAPPTFPTPGGGSGSGTGGLQGGVFSLAALLQAIFDYINDLIEYLHDLMLWLISQATFPLTYPVRHALYMLKLGFYTIYQSLRWALATSGYTFPDPYMLNNPLAQQFINPNPPFFDSTNPTAMNTPRREFPVEKDNAILYPIGCPSPLVSIDCLEPAAARSGPFTRWPLNYPFWFIEGEPTNLAVEEALMNADTPEITRGITTNLNFPRPGLGLPTQPYSGSLGSAIDFFLRRASDIASDGGNSTILKDNLKDMNLDADRGYGYKCWKITHGSQVPEEVEPLEPPNPNGVPDTYNNVDDDNPDIT